MSPQSKADPRSPSEPFWLKGHFAPVANEVTAHELPVEGELPQGLAGTYVRNGPNPKDGVSPHWWFGDGMVHGIHLTGGKARWYRNRYVRTAKFTGTALGPTAPGEDAGAVRARRLRGGGTSNTHVTEHGGRILSMVEAALPMELDRELSTVGAFDFGGAVDTPMTAHPKRCPLTGELHFFGYQVVRPYLTYYIADAGGRVISKREIEVEGASYMHDFAITERYAVFFDSPARMTRDWSAGMPFDWSDSHPARIGVVPRQGGKVRWFDVEPGQLGHTANAFERAGTLVLEGIRSARFEAAPPYLYRWEIDLESGHTRERQLDGRPVEFPRIDGRRNGQPHRYTYVIEMLDFADGVPGGARLRRYDSETDTSLAQELGPGQIPGECVFVPKSAQSPEDGGWLLSLVCDSKRDISELVVLDAGNFGAAPVARVRLPQRVPFGIHGSWVTVADERAAPPAGRLPRR
ncbi:carotenoid cleavage dioxygenase [Stigmatella aurantiaca]|uniref:Carotenoid cleavage dioxygenase n=1 Tax=Stigmatella aurantiaca TaxID=41 RepID=A0A1H7FQ23_STIAU|nr:carotenoid oxygenase family protein [Stigmatella aurantiaca]SEK28058.1 carotenoid cleavage dioxygenase [Stigmatella aurantiaca]